MRLFCIAIAVSLVQICFGSGGVRIIDDRLAFEAKVNGQPVILGFDTGTERTCLFRATVRRLGLSVTDPPPDAKVPQGYVPTVMSEECDLAIDHIVVHTELAVLDVPQGLSPGGVDGILAWYNVQNHIFRISGAPMSLTILPALPKDIASWTKWPIDPQYSVLTIELPETEGRRGRILVDTGSFFGVELNSRRWRQWREAHKDAPATPVAFFMPGSGLHVREQCWADKLEIGGFTITDVPVIQGRPDEQYPVSSEAVIGLFGLLRFEVIIDGAQDSFYTRSAPMSPLPYKHNRLGAVFAPKDLESQDLIGYVVEGGPAYQAGIQNGDILLSVDGLDVTQWRTDPNARPGKFWEQPAGTEHRLTLLRDGRQLECAVKLCDILGPHQPRSASSTSATPSSASDANQR
jgi:hypothetical protein